MSFKSVFCRRTRLYSSKKISTKIIILVCWFQSLSIISFLRVKFKQFSSTFKTPTKKDSRLPEPVSPWLNYYHNCNRKEYGLQTSFTPTPSVRQCVLSFYITSCFVHNSLMLANFYGKRQNNWIVSYEMIFGSHDYVYETQAMVKRSAFKFKRYP